MISIRFDRSGDYILTFDGTVLEVFRSDRSRRIHIYQIKSIQVTADRKGERTLDLEVQKPWEQIPETFVYDEQLDAKVNDLVTQVRQAMAAARPE